MNLQSIKSMVAQKEQQEKQTMQELKLRTLVESNITKTTEEYYAFVNRQDKLATTGFGTKLMLLEYVNCIRFDNKTVILMKERYEKLFNNKTAQPEISQKERQEKQKPKDTQGEWNAEYSRNTGWDVFQGAEHIASIKQTVKNEAEANTKLIAAAPDLLEALMKLKPLYDGRNNEYERIINEAIKKATE